MVWENQKIIKKSKRGIAGIIGTLFLIAITAVGGTITFVSTDNIINKNQIAGNPEIDYLKIVGYDTRNSCTLTYADGTQTSCGAAGPEDELLAGTGEVLRFDERIAVYVVNHSAKKVLLNEVRFGGTVYNVTSSSVLSSWNDFIDFVPGQYAISDSGTSVLVPNNQEIQPGQTVTLIFDLESDYKTGRTAQFRVETTNNFVFVKDVKIGEHIFLN